MLKKATFYLIGLGLAAVLLVGFRQAQAPESNMIIVIENKGSNMVAHISEEGGLYREQMISGKQSLNYSHALNLVDKYQQEGWRIRESSFTGSVVEDPNFTSLPDHFHVLYFRLTR